MGISLLHEFEQLWGSGDGSPDVFAFLADRLDSNESDVLAVLLRDQLRRWQTHEPLKVEEYLDRLPALASNSHAKIQLAIGEFQSRFSGDTIPSIEEFTSRFNDISDVLRPELEQVVYATVKPDSTVREQYIGRYRLSRMLGKGAFGIVWLAFDTELHRQVAIKVPTAERFKRPEDAETYLAEARMVARLDHPNIVPVHDVGRIDDGSVYVVSKFIEGGTLADRISKSRASFDESAKVIATCAMALGHAHEKRLIHRDIKPANILIEDATNTPYVADFGLAIREEDYAQNGGIAGTPAYMSPEQARGEGHRLDGRSDIFSLGTVLYELLTGRRPFRGSTPNELMYQVVSIDPASPRETDETVPSELDRICLKALSKRASDRYATAALFADDLLHWDQSPGQELKELQITPKGLRSFDAADADFFLDLLPGPRNRDGLPESIQFWKTRIEETDADKTFAVGLIYGPSGCGKSSLVKAGLLPRLSKDAVSVYVEATSDDTETRILRGLRKRLPELADDLSLVDTFTWLRRQEGRKVVVVLDQFEQWLHAHRTELSTELVVALRQCDGGTLQAVVMVRDDFSMAATRFMRELETRILEGHNFATVDLFDVDHAQNVLIKFGQAFGKLPAQTGKLTEQESAFCATVATGLAQDGKVVSVRVALFAEMIKAKPWVQQTLIDVGGTEGIGVNFLEETFSSRDANPEHRLHQQSAREVLRALLPEVGSDIKGHMRSHAELLAASSYAARPAEFNELLRILDGELRLITPTDPEGFQSDAGSDPSVRFYQLTHDYLVPSLRQWLTQKQQETRKGRAELRLAERSALWNTKPENRHLPNLAEWVRICTLTDRNTWTKPQSEMMRRAKRVHFSQLATALTSVVLLTIGGLWVKSRLDETHMRTTARERVAALLNAETRDVPKLVEGLLPYRQWTDDDLQQALSSEDAKQQLHARIALLPVDSSHVESLKQLLLDATPENALVLSKVLEPSKAAIVEEYWPLVASSDNSPVRRLAAGAALAKFSPADSRWSTVAGSISRLLVDENPLRLATWIDAFRPVRASLIPELGVIFRDQSDNVSPTQRDLATNVLETYAADSVDELAGLILDAQPKQFAALFDELKAHGNAAKEKMLAALEGKPARGEPWDSTHVVSLTKKPVSTQTRENIEAAQGMLTDRFALAQSLMLDDVLALTENLGQSGYRPVRLRPYNSKAVNPNPETSEEVSALWTAAVWHRDGRPWRVALDLLAEEMQSRDEQLRGEGFAAVDVAGYIGVRDGKLAELFSAVWVERKDDQEDSRIYLAATSTKNHGAASRELKAAGFEFQLSLHAFRGTDGQPRYSGVKSRVSGIGKWSWDNSPDAYSQIIYVDRPQWDVSLSLASPPEAIRKQFKRQNAEATQLLSVDSNDLNARFLRAIAFYQLAMPMEALSDLDLLIDAAPEVAISYRYRACCHARMGNEVLANSDLDKFRELSASDSTMVSATAIVFAHLGEYTDASQSLAELAPAVRQQGSELYNVACIYAILYSIAKNSGSERTDQFRRAAITTLNASINKGYDDFANMRRDADLESLHDDSEYQSIIKRGQLDRTYAAVWNQDPDRESRELHGITCLEHLQAMRDFERDGFVPVSIAGLVVDNQSDPITASVWHRRPVSSDTSEKFAKRQANAAAALARLGLREEIFAALRIIDDPESLTQFVHRCRGQGVTTLELLECLQVTDRNRQALSGDARRTEDHVLFGLLLALGEFTLGELPREQKQPTVERVSSWFRNDPSSAIHSATGWLLRQWGQSDLVRQVDETAEPYNPEREWFTLVIESGEQRLYQTYVVIPPGEYDIGSPANQPAHESNETLNRVRLTRAVAILDREVTREEFEASGVANLNVAQYSPTGEHPMVAPSWYDSVRYCRWLTEKAGLSEGEQAYADPSSLDKSQYPPDGDTGLPQNWPLKLDARGFRLPTEAEWEIAARGGMRTKYGFGGDESLLERYAWLQTNSERRTHIAKELRPNLRGLFDMQGNTYEWCHDWYGSYPLGSVRSDPIGSETGSRRVSRGGGWFSDAAGCRTAYRSDYQPTNRARFGLRVALVLLDPAPSVSEPESEDAEGVRGAATRDAAASRVARE